jgi:hypothetical protein
MEIGKLSLYINGKLEGSNQDTTTGNTKTNSPLYLGCRGYQNAGMNYFIGSIKGLSIYNVALSAEQIQAVVNPTPVKPIILDGQLQIPCKLETGVEFTIILAQSPRTSVVGCSATPFRGREGFNVVPKNFSH